MPVTSGVPQGSVLGPLLFLIYISGCANTTLNDDSDVTLYADDLSLFRAIWSPEDYDKLQEDINELVAWVTTSLLKLSVNIYCYQGAEIRHKFLSYIFEKIPWKEYLNTSIWA